MVDNLEDDVIDAALGLLSAGVVTTDVVDSNDRDFLNVFPFLASANAAAVPEPGTASLGLIIVGCLAARRRRRQTKLKQQRMIMTVLRGRPRRRMDPACGRFFFITTKFALLLMAGFAFAAEPFKPSTDDEVLVVLPAALMANRSEMAALKKQLISEPANEQLAANIALRYVQIGNSEGDPRYYGYARAAVERWWEATSPSATIRSVRAKLKEKDHLYKEALEDLKQIVEIQPRDAQAWIEIANLYRVLGEYDLALEVGDRLEQFAGEVPTALCRAPIWALTGRAKDADELLTNILPAARKDFPSTVHWIMTVRAEIASAMGHADVVEQHYRDGLADEPGNLQLIRRFADFLIDHDRADEALSLTAESTADNGVLLAAAIAAKRVGDQEKLAGFQDQLESRFEEIRLRGGQPHGRFEARYLLELNGDAPAALKVALLNWERQKEIQDTRIVLESAIAAGDRDAAEPVLQFLAEENTHHAVLDRLVDQLQQL